jgi:hypothetical protein
MLNYIAPFTRDLIIGIFGMFLFFVFIITGTNIIKDLFDTTFNKKRK